MILGPLGAGKANRLTGEEVGIAVAASYRALYKLLNGRTVAIAPLEIADLHDHKSSLNADSMHDLCLPRLPQGAKLSGVRIAADLIQDPNGDPNPPRGSESAHEIVE